MEDNIEVTVKNDDSIRYNVWMMSTVDKFRLLSNDQRVNTISTLIEMCGLEELHRLTAILPPLLYRDFLTLLPPPVVDKILDYLDIDTIMLAQLVSKSWNR